MSSTGTRQPLFDPDPSGFDDDAAPGFPLRRPGRGRGPGDGGGDSPRWVRPFLLGGLLLAALITVLGLITGDGGDAQPAEVAASADAGAADQTAAGSATADGDADAAEDIRAGADQAGAADVDVDPADGVAPAQGGTSPAGTDAATAAGAVAANDPATAGAEPFAVQFAHDYLNLDEAAPQVRQRELRAYLAPGLDPQLGWDGTGVQIAVLTVPVRTEVVRDDVLRDDEADGVRVVVTVAAQVTGRDAPRWVHLAVPLARDDSGRWAVTAAPTYVPRPLAGAPEPAAEPEVDDPLSQRVRPLVESVMAAYAADEVVSLDGQTDPTARIRGLDGQVSLVDVPRVRALAADGGDDGTRVAHVDVRWLDDITGTTVTQTYGLELVPDGERWLVAAIRPR